jgi:hypothetical protein
MEQLSVIQEQKQEAEDNLANQLTATKEELMTAKTTCERLGKELAIANDRLGKWSNEGNWVVEFLDFFS